jgi:NTE family protein
MATRSTHRFPLTLVCALLLAMPPGAVAGPIPSSGAAARPRIGLALSGGGARGAAHVGVLKVLERHRIPIDCIAGTSMGALVGGFYASGMSAAELERVISELDWSEAFADKIPRQDRSFHRKRDDDLYLVKNKPGLRDAKLLFPPGIIDGHRIDLLLKRYTLPVVTIRDFDSLQVPFRAVAADIVTGDAVVLGKGDLALAMRASMAIPAVFAPREIDGRLLVDGGITDNMPIEVVRRMGADVIIAVDISTPPAGREKLGSVISITSQLTTLTSQHNKVEQIASLDDRDVFIRPDLGSITVASFEYAAAAIPIGERAAEAALGKLAPLSVSEEEYRVYQAKRSAGRARPDVDALKLVNRSRISDDVLAARLDVDTGGPLDVDQLERALDQIYGLELFESVYYDITPEAERNMLTVTARERSWGPNYLQGGVAVFEDFEGPNFNVALAYSRTAINRRSGEIHTGLQVGQEPGAFVGLYQPLDRTLRHFVDLQVSAGERTLNVFDREGHKLSELGLTRYGVDAAGGRELGTWGELRAGVVRAAGEIRTQVGETRLPGMNYDTGEAFVQFFLDRLDDTAFPHSGASVRSRVSAGLEALGSSSAYEQVVLEASGARTWGRYTTLLGAMGATTLDSDAPAQSVFRLGGFGRLSGLEQDELSGQHAALASAVLYRRIGHFNLFPLQAGLSAEYGNTFQTRSAVRPEEGIVAGTVFLGLDTLIGPLHVAYGLAEGGRQNYYLTLGQSLMGRRAGPGYR